MPCYNYGRFLPDCLNSILRQEGDYAFEVIAIDDASSDNTLEVLEQFTDPRLRVVRQLINQGHVKTITRGLREAGGEFVARIDPDDCYRPYFLREVMPRFECHPEVAFVYGDAALINEEGHVTCECSDTHHKARDFKGNEFIALLMDNFVCAPTVIARREAWLEALPVPENLAFNDWYFNLMIARKHDFYYVNRVLANYRVHSANLHSQITRDRTEEPSTVLLLDSIYETKEEDPALERTKQGLRSEVYAAHYVRLADKYFGYWMVQDARRCYLEAIRHTPRRLFSWTILRRLVATGLKLETYNRLKRTLRYLQT